jgi:caffeoyl-CoA O-methyltransferase
MGLGAPSAVYTEIQVSFIVNEPVEKYAEEHTTPVPSLFERLAAETVEKSTAPQMMVGLLEGRFLELLVRQTKAKNVLELGTFTGWSSISMAMGLVEGGRITTCDISEETTVIARHYAEEAGVADRIDYRIGPALETIASLDGPFDLVFIDADKPNYINYYEAVFPKLADDGLVVADNVLWSGRVADPPNQEESTLAIRAFNDHVMADDRVVCVMLTVRDGMLLIGKK